MPILRLSHVGICVSDLERSQRFYCDQLGFTPQSKLHVKGEPSDTLLGLEHVDLRAVYLERDGVCIELLHFASPATEGTSHDGSINRLGLTHLSLRVSDLASTLAKLDAAGVAVDARSRIENPQLGSAAIFVRDPDGTRALVENAERDGVKVIIAGAGMSAALPGYCASLCSLPVIGVPVASGPLSGIDALLAIVSSDADMTLRAAVVGALGKGNLGTDNEMKLINALTVQPGARSEG